MAIVVETGAGLANANSFVTRAEALAYAEARGVVLDDEDTTDALLIRACDFVHTWESCLSGSRKTTTQALAFPREGYILRGQAFPDDAVPVDAKKAQLELILAQHAGVNLFPTDDSPFIRREKVGPLETEYWGDSNTANTRVSVPAAEQWLDVLCAGGDGGAALTTVRV